MLALTQNAVDVVRAIVTADEAPEGAGLRIAVGEGSDIEESLELSLSAGPEQHDQILSGEGAVIFLDEQAASYLDDKVLDAAIDDDGQASFELALQSEPDAEAIAAEPDDDPTRQ